MHDMDAPHPGALCGSVFDAIWPVSDVPRAQRGPKGAPKMKIFTFWLFDPRNGPRSGCNQNIIVT